MKKIRVIKSVNYLTLLQFLFSTLSFYVPSFHNHAIMEDLEEYLEIHYSAELSNQEHEEDHESCSFKIWLLNIAHEFVDLKEHKLFYNNVEEKLSFYISFHIAILSSVGHGRAPPSHIS